jgi:hypothetical protein
VRSVTNQIGRNKKGNDDLRPGTALRRRGTAIGSRKGKDLERSHSRSFHCVMEQLFKLPRSRSPGHRRTCQRRSCFCLALELEIGSAANPARPIEPQLLCYVASAGPTFVPPPALCCYA